MSNDGEQNNQEGQSGEATPADDRTAKQDSVARAADADRMRRIQALEMSRERVLSERTSSPHRRSALELALASIEYELEQLGWSIKI